MIWQIIYGIILIIQFGVHLQQDISDEKKWTTILANFIVYGMFFFILYKGGFYTWIK
jgi:hypothetical protein